MTRRRNLRHLPSSHSLAAYRLRVEPLEPRRLLAGLQVSVFVDQDGSRSFDRGTDEAAPNRLVYVDLDRNGSHDFGEPIQVTNADGQAFFKDLAAGNYSIGLLTNPNTQQLSTAVHVQSMAKRESEFVAGFLLADDLLENAWTIDEVGVAKRLDSTDVVRLGGHVLSHTQLQSDLAGLVVDAADGSGPKYVEFNLNSGRTKTTDIRGLEQGDQIRTIVATANATFVLVDTEQGPRLGQLKAGELASVVSELYATDVTTLAGSLKNGGLAAISTSRDGNTSVQLAGANFSTLMQRPTLLEGKALSAVFSRNGQRLMIAMEGGGVNVLSVDGNNLRLEAVLADATVPVSAESQDGRLLTGSVSDRQEVVVWDTRLWMPIGSSHLLSDRLSGNSTILTDRFGDRSLIASDNGVFAVDLAVANNVNVTLSAGATTSVEVGVRVSSQRNSIPDVKRVGTRTIDEDTQDVFASPEQLGVTDADGNSLWFSLLTRPSHGKLEQLRDGSWSYLPNRDYAGNDRAVLLVHDGQASVELVLQWQINAVNDPPLDFYVHLPSVPEDLKAGSALGFVTIVDPDRGAMYRIASSDPRFNVIEGQAYFAGGSLDFETEPSISFELTATDATNPDFTISTTATLVLTDVNEAPRSIRLNTAGIPENAGGVVVGSILVDDPDADSQYEYEVSDDRFFVRDGVLQLREGIEFDYETQDHVEINIVAREVGTLGMSIVQRISIPILDRNDPPTQIRLVNSSVSQNTDGAIVGSLSVDDADHDRYTYRVSDQRFEVKDGVLKLREGSQIEDTEPRNIILTVVATAANGDEFTDVLPVVVVPQRSPLQNPKNPRDVNRDGIVSPLDALILINELNRRGTGRPTPSPGSATGEGSAISPDVNGDGIISPQDVLIIINELNSSRAMSEGEGESAVLPLNASSSIPADDYDRRRKQTNSAIDAELESLVEELSWHRVHRF